MPDLGYFVGLYTAPGCASHASCTLSTELGVRPSDVSMIAANPWDAAGAAKVELTAVYLIKGDLLEGGLKPAAVVKVAAGLYSARSQLS